MLQTDIATLRQRLVKAESDMAGWRAAGEQEKYIEAYCLIEALERQLKEQVDRNGSDPGGDRSSGHQRTFAR